MQVLGGRAPAFSNDKLQSTFIHVQENHERQRVQRKVMRELRKVLKRKRKYESSKIALLDEFHVKLTELGREPIHLKANVTAPSVNDAKRWETFVTAPPAVERVVKKRRGRPRKEK